MLALVATLTGLAFGWIRGAVGVVGNELFLFPPPTLRWDEIYLLDMGLPSLVHNVLIAPLHAWGGVAGVLGLHAALDVLTWIALLVALRRVAGEAAAVAAVAVLATSDVWLYQEVELRSYASYLACATVALLGLVPARDGTRRQALALAGFGLAALDSPAIAVVLAASAVGLAVQARGIALRTVLLGGLREGDADARTQRGVLLALLGLVPLSIASADLHHVEGGALVFLDRPVVLTEIVLFAASAAWVGWRRADLRALVVTSVALLATPVTLVLAGSLRDDPKYELVALPACALVVLAALDEVLSGFVARTRAIAAVGLVVGLATVHRPWTPSVPYPWDLPLEAWTARAFGVGVGVSVVWAALVSWRGRRVTAVAWAPLVVVTALQVAWWQGVRAYALAVDLGGAGAACDAAESVRVHVSTGAEVCGAAGEWTLRCRARAVARARASSFEPLRRAATDPAYDAIVETCPDDRPTVRVYGESGTPPPDCTVAATVRAGDDVEQATRYVVVTCAPGVR